MVSVLDIDLLWRRSSAPYYFALALAAVAVAIHVLVTAPLNARSDALEREHVAATRAATAAQPASAPPRTLLEERLAAFMETLGDRRELAGMVATVFEQAEKHGLVLAQAEYKLEFDKAGGFYIYQMRLPLRGSYPRLRGFVDATLAKIPCAALENVDFKREAIGAAEAEAQLRLLFFLKDARP